MMVMILLYLKEVAKVSERETDRGRERDRERER